MKENEKKTNCIYSLNDKFTCEPVEHSVQSWGPKKKKKEKNIKWARTQSVLFVEDETNPILRKLKLNIK